MCRSAVLAEMLSSTPICLVCSPASEEPDHRRFPVGQTRGTLDRWRRLAHGLDHRSHRIGIESPGLRFCRQLLHGLLGWQRRPVGPRLGHGAARIGGGEDSSRPLERRRASAPVVPGAVEPLVVVGRDRRERRQHRRSGEYPIRVVGVEPHLLPVARAQRARVVPDPYGHRARPMSCTNAARRSARTDAGSRPIASPAVAARRATMAV